MLRYFGTGQGAELPTHGAYLKYVSAEAAKLN